MQFLETICRSERFLLTCCCALVVCVNTQLADAAETPLDQIRTVAYSDQVVSGRLVTEPLDATLNDQGAVAFLTSGRKVLWAEQNEQLNFLSGFGLNINRLFLNDVGDVILSDRLRVRKWNSSGLTLLAGSGFPVVDQNGVPLANFLETEAEVQAVGSAGDVIYLAGGSRPGVNFPEVAGFWLNDGTPRSSRLLVALNDPVPGRPEGTTFANSDSFSVPRLNANGVFVMGMDIIDTNGVDRDSIITNRSGQLEVLFAVGDQVPGGLPGETFSGFGGFSGISTINDQGDIVFRAGTRGGPDDGGIMIDRQGQLNRVATPGQQVLTNDGVRNMNRVFGGLAINGNGSIAFGARFLSQPQGLVQHAVIVEQPNGDLRSVLTTGDPVPGGTPESSLTMKLDNRGGFNFNRLGQVAIFAQIFSSGNNTGPYGVLAYDPVLGVVAIAKAGDLIEVAPGDIREVASASIALERGIYSSGNEDGMRSSLNERGEIVFLARFTDGTSGLFVSDAIAVPEPSALLLLAGFAGPYGFFSRRRRARR